MTTIDPAAALALPPPERVTRQRRELRRMRSLASLLLLAMTALFVAASIFETRWPGLGYVRAFAEASMVGACADWFAVVALLRHPLGIPIPHTAIVPRNKARIGDTIGAFICNNFLAPPVVAARLQTIDVAGWWARSLAAPGTAAAIARGSADFVGPLIELLDHETVRRFLREATRRGLEATPVAPIAVGILSLLRNNGQLLALAERLIEYADDALVRNHDLLRDKVSEQSSWWIPKWLDAKIADRLVTGVRGTLSELRAPGHPWRGHFTAWVDDLIDRLSNDAATIAAAERVKAELLAHPAMADGIDRLWRAIEARLREGAAGEGGFVALGLERALAGFGGWLEGDPNVRALVNRWSARTIESTVVPHRNEIGNFIAGVVRHWDDRTLIEKIELQVGKDLQYIRINGTLVGGLVGLLIYIATQLATDLAPLLSGAPR
jgi:uncharacterized membrane-anchored protein YjiN (DUF445 family)